MNKPLLAMCSLLIVVSLVASVIYHLQFEDESARNIIDQPDFDESKFTDEEWRKTILAMAQFETAPTEEAEVTEQTEQTIDDAVLVAIIADSPSSILLLTPNSATSPEQLAIGEGWLENWIIQDIKPDAVHWSNTTTKQVITQYLFKQPETGENE